LLEFARELSVELGRPPARTVDTQTVLGAIAAHLMAGMAFAFVYPGVQAGTVSEGRRLPRRHPDRAGRAG
jgi:hypothetical protein